VEAVRSFEEEVAREPAEALVALAAWGELVAVRSHSRQWAERTWARFSEVAMLEEEKC